LREHRTLAQVARYFERRLAGGSGRRASVPPRASSPPPSSVPVLRASITARSDATTSSPHHDGARIVRDERLLAIAIEALGVGASPALRVRGLRFDAPVLVPSE